MNELWQAVLGEVEVNVSRGNYNAWFKNTELIDNQDGRVVIAVPNVFTKQQMEVKFTGQILEIFNKIGEPVKQITYTIKSVGKKKTNNNIQIADQSPTTQVVTSPKASVNSSGLNPKLVFETFVVGSSNELAYTACQTIAKSPGTKYNPLFLYGGVGLGKTHLIQAVGNAIHQKKPSARILYISTETFVSEFVDSLRFKRPGFSDRYRSVDVLIVDDIQFIAGKEKTQEEFFHTFNVLHQTDKQIIVSSDKPPKSIPTLEDRLRSRLEWGMAIDIQTPDFETRCAILQNKASQSGVTLERETAEYLSAHIQTNIRELEGALNQLLAFCEMRGTSPDLQTASGLLGNVRATRPHHITIKQIIEKTARHFQVELIDILSPRRDKYIALPRQVAMYLLRSELHLSFPKIANELGRKDHTTAIHSVDKIEKAIKLDYIIRQQVSEIREKLYV